MRVQPIPLPFDLPWPGRSARRGLAAAAFLLASGTSHAAGDLLQFAGDIVDGSSPPPATLTATNLEAFPDGERFSVTLPSGAIAGGTVLGVSDSPPPKPIGDEDRSLSITLDDGAGSVELHLSGDAVVGITVFQRADVAYFRSAVGNDGAVNLVAEDANGYQCIDMPIAPPEPLGLDIGEAVPLLTVAQLKDLQSRPGAPKVIFIDYWGGTVTGTQWNTDYTGGAPIPYANYDTDANPGAFSADELRTMYLGYLEAADDYVSFNVNVTTKESVFNATAEANRSRMIATPTCAWEGCTSGGLAYVPGFGNALFNTGWTWNLDRTSMGMTHSHESGHQMGLSHDGTTTLGYYGGHGQWGPIMGAPFGKAYVQWSKGEYPAANNTENDFAIINGMLGSLADDVPNNTTYPIVAGAGYNWYWTTPAGSSAPPPTGIDTDAFNFTVTTPGSVTVKVQPTLGILGETIASNAALSYSIVQYTPPSTHTTIDSQPSSMFPPLSPATNKYEYTNAAMPAGQYYLKVVADSPDTNWATGFGNWGNGGGYGVSYQGPTGTPPGPPGKPTLVTPTGTGGTQETYTWNAVVANPATSYYYLWIQNQNGPIFYKWYTAAQVGCATGTTCTMSPGLKIGGNVTWWIQAYNNFSGGSYGSWSAAKSYTTGAPPNPGRVTLLAPSGGGAGASPTFTWNSVADANWYRLWIQDNAGAYKAKWFTASALACAGGGVCTTAGVTVPDASALAATRKWYVLADNYVASTDYFSLWSTGMSYSP